MGGQASTVELGHANLNDVHVVILSRYFPGRNELEAIDLEGNPEVSGRGASAIAEVVPRCSRLRTVNLSGTGVNPTLAGIPSKPREALNRCELDLWKSNI